MVILDPIESYQQLFASEVVIYQIGLTRVRVSMPTRGQNAWEDDKSLAVRYSIHT